MSRVKGFRLGFSRDESRLMTVASCRASRRRRTFIRLLEEGADGSDKQVGVRLKAAFYHMSRVKGFRLGFSRDESRLMTVASCRASRRRRTFIRLLEEGA